MTIVLYWDEIPDTLQGVTDWICNHLMVQDNKCVLDGTNACCYRNEVGEACAIGCLIPEEFLPERQYSIEHVEWSIVGEIQYRIKDFPEDGNIRGFLYRFQRLHDSLIYNNFVPFNEVIDYIEYIQNDFDVKFKQEFIDYCKSKPHVICDVH